MMVDVMPEKRFFRFGTITSGSFFGSGIAAGKHGAHDNSDQER